MALKWVSSSQKVANYYQQVKVESDGQEIIDLNKPYIKDINMLLVFVNGVEQSKDSYSEDTSTTIKFVSNYLRENDEISIYYIPSKVSLGEIRVVSSYVELLNVAEPMYNELAICVNDRKFYIYGDSGWREFVLPFSTQNVGVMFLYEKQQVEDITERTYTLQDIKYSPGMNNMLVFIDGVKVDPSDYEEVDQMTITFYQDLPIGSQEIELIVANNDTWEESNNHNVEYIYNANETIDKEIVKVGLNTVKETQFIYDANENIITEIISRGNKTITKNYSYDVLGNIINMNVVISS